MKIPIRVFQDLPALNRAVLEETDRLIAEAVQQRGRFAIALSGGHTPAEFYTLWAQRDRSLTPWDRVHLFWGDERYVPSDDPLSNYRMTLETFISHVPIPQANVHRVRTELATPEETAADYESTLRSFFGSAPPQFDVQLLGLGGEGHTASLFPGSPGLRETKRWVMAVEAPAKPPHRLTFTPVVLNQGRNTYFLVAGSEKREIIQKLRQEPDGNPSGYPALEIRPSGRLAWFLDQSAAG
ncbi:MAG TPA: 6-phosphogluconolactonase [Verrucomicrobiae bacterium]|nr:6-phosphogluconolactonase [Verrucomicrobiae bacterium]